MKLFSCCVAIFAFPLGLIQALPLEPALGDAKIGTMREVDLFPEVHFLLFTRKNNEAPQLLDIHNQTAMAETNFDINKPTKVIIHGWSSNPYDVFAFGVREAYLNVSDVNVICIDWSPVGDWDYIEAARAAPLIADFVVEMLIRLMEFGVKSESIHVIGHSMGAQIAGIAGLRSPVLLPRVTGLDPAGPIFGFSGHIRISPQSAQFVDIIHSCAGLQGISSSCGHADFYPNGGTPIQPGCGIDIDIFPGGCSHARSQLYFRESILRPGAFMATPCMNYNAFRKNNCHPNGELVEMGEYTPKSASGDYYLFTNDAPPFGRGQGNM